MSEHHMGEGYSARHQVPTIQNYKKEQAAMEAALLAQHVDPDSVSQAEKQAAFEEARHDTAMTGESTTAPRSEQPVTEAPPLRKDGTYGPSKSKADEKKEMMDKANAGHGNPAKDFQAKGERTVDDPVTGQPVIIKDASTDGVMSQEQLDPTKNTAGPSLKAPPANEDIKTLHTAPSPASPTNILLQQFPPPIKVDSFVPIASTIHLWHLSVSAVMVAAWLMTAFRAGAWAFIIRTAFFSTVAVVSFFASGLLEKKILNGLEDVRLEMHRQRGEKHSPPTPESTEWLNALFAVVWPLISEDMFVSMVDMVEDVMQQSLPGFVEAVRISDFGIGTEPLRIISMRGLPDKAGSKGYPREEWIDLGQNPDAAKSDVAQTKEKEKEQAELSADPQQKEEVDLDQSGDYVNYEVSLAYSARSAKSTSQRASNIHLLIEFFLGAFDWLRIPIPIWIQVETIILTARIRLQMVQQPPFIRNLTFTLMGVPKIEISAVPMSRALPNVLDLPLISGFVQSSIAAAANEYVAPKSMTMNLAQMMSGDGIKKDTDALGVLVVKIRYAVDLSAQDSNGKSDPYVVLSYAKFGKPLYSTRIIPSDLNPVWEETAILLVTPDEVKSEETLSVQLWDSDARSADDLVGRVHVPLADIMRNPNQMSDRTDSLEGFEDADTMKGQLFWSVGYYSKAKLDRSLQNKLGANADLPKELQDAKQMKTEAPPVDTDEEAAALTIPPSPKYKSGILSVIVHQINSLEVQNLKGSSGKDREGVAGQDTDAPEEEGKNMPSSYCEIVVNDDIIYKTRTKLYSSMPFFEAGTETFVRDWENTVVRVAVRDARLREHDPLLGVVSVKLSEIFKHASQVTRMFALQEGVGFGRARISFLFKAVQTELPYELTGWETGTLEILDNVNVEPATLIDDLDTKKIKLVTSDSQEVIPSKAATINGNTMTWELEKIRMPVYNRYQNSICFEFGVGSLPGINAGIDAIAVLWLQDLPDDEEKHVRIPILKGKNLNSLRLNYISEATAQHHSYETVGWLSTTVCLDSGLDPDHDNANKGQAARHEYEIYDHVEGQAIVAQHNAHANDDGVIDKREQKEIDRAKKKALESRHRGKMQLAPYRTSIWATNGLKNRLRRMVGKGPVERDIPSEIST